MPTPTGYYEYTRLENGIYVRVVGQGNMNNSMALKEFGDRMVRDGYSRFTFDLGRCTGMDSTFMGTLMAVALTTQAPGQPGVLIINASVELRDLLENLGLTKFVRICDSLAVPKDLELRCLEQRGSSGPDRVRFIKDMHEYLARIDERNRTRFGPFIESISREFIGE